MSRNFVFVCVLVFFFFHAKSGTNINHWNGSVADLSSIQAVKEMVPRVKSVFEILVFVIKNFLQKFFFFFSKNLIFNDFFFKYT